MKTILIDYKNVSARFEALSMCLGYFDGVHKGHAHLIKEARKYAKYDLGLLTFDKPVSTLVDNGKSSDVLTALDDRFKVISKLGVDYYFVVGIDKEFLNFSDDEFIDFLKKMNVKEIFVGKDYRYGRKAMGTISKLQDYFDVRVIDIQEVEHTKISTQDIIKDIQEGKIEEANNLLGHNYVISGTVVHGNRIGTTIGFPTLNLKMKTNYVLPKFGVYKTICYVDHIPHLAITNVGVKPTISDNNEPVIEVHLIDLKSNVNFYEASIDVEFLKFVRPEMKFSSLEELKNQIDSDIKNSF